MNKEVSIIIPTYNPKDCLFECLESISRQDFNCNKYEVIIVLNGDIKYKNSIEKYICAKMPDIEVVVLFSSSVGVSAARNLGLNFAKGKYILFVDDDDLLSPNYISILYKYASDNCIVVSNALLFKQKEGLRYDSFITKTYKNTMKESKIEYSHRSYFSTVWGKLIPQKTIGKNRFNENLFIGEDCCFMISILPNISKIRKCDEEALYLIRERVNSASRKRWPFYKIIKNKIYQLIDYTRYIRYYLGNHPILYLNRIASVVLKWR